MPEPIRVFVAFATCDQARALEVCDALEKHDGVSSVCSAKDLRSGEQWYEFVSRELPASAALVAVLSKASAANPNVRFEVRRALTLGKPVIPLMIEQVSEDDLERASMLPILLDTQRRDHVLGTRDLTDVVADIRWRLSRDVPNVAVASRPAPLLTITTAGVVQSVSGPRRIDLEGDRLRFVGNDGECRDEMTLPFPASTAVLSARGDLIVAASDDQVALVRLLPRSFDTPARCDVNGVARVHAVAEWGDLLAVLVSTEDATERIVLDLDRHSVTVAERVRLRNAPVRSAVQHDRGLCIVDAAGAMTVSDDLKRAIEGDVPLDGWLSVDLAAAGRDLVVAGIRDDDGQLVLGGRQRIDGRWLEPVSLDVAGCDRVHIARAGWVGDDSTVHAYASGTHESWTWDELRRQGAREI